MKLAEEAGLERPRVIGCVRSYGTRHGAGPFPSEFPDEYDWTKEFPELHNGTGEFQGKWRVGLLDLPLFRHAVKATGGVDVLSISHADVPFKRAVDSYTLLEENPLPLEYVENRDIHPWTELLLSDELKASASHVEISGVGDLVSTLNTAAGLPYSTETIVSYGPVTNQRKWNQ